ncbi:MAG: N-acetylmuramoyl-L-alanine amidase [Saprospiraceae bacterium]|nr:N-acetylmuramoyl-L-alanine amidase [Saprospiraceae bacterium]
MKGALLLLAWICMLPLGQAAAETIYFKAEARPGDGVYALLRRYQLDAYPCNFEAFYSINQMRSNKHLLAGKAYFLPILIYTYNGKSIRSTLGNDDLDKALRIQEYNNQMYKNGLRQDVFTNSNILWVPYHELHCADKMLAAPEAEPTPPGPTGARKYDIFGGKYAYTPLKSSRLQGKIFYVVSGHGGPDPGAMSTRQGKQLCEDEYAYDVALRFCRLLIQHGATAYMITRDPNDGIRDAPYLACDTDETIWQNQAIPRGQIERLTQRSDAINDLASSHLAKGQKDQTAIIIHVDSRTRSQKTDVFFYHHPSSSSSKSIATNILKAINQKYSRYQPGRVYDGTVKARDLHMLREVSIPAVYVELANIRNPSDQVRIVEPRNRQLLAEWMLDAFLP